jgi:DNA-binding phage protein
MKKPLTFDQMLDESLKNFEGCLFYLQHALEGNDLAHFIEAFGHVVKAQGGVGKFSTKTKITRQTIYNAVNSKGLRASSLFEIVKALGLRFDLVPLEAKAPRAKRTSFGRAPRRTHAEPHALAA